MSKSKRKSYVVKCDGVPVKMMHLEKQCVKEFMQRITSRYRTHRWSVSERFPLAGAD